jgi:hypothetical protein
MGWEPLCLCSGEVLQLRLRHVHSSLLPGFRFAVLHAHVMLLGLANTWHLTHRGAASLEAAEVVLVRRKEPERPEGAR